MEQRELFSREAMEKLHSPERLDKLLPITTPMNWIAMAAMGVLLLSVLLWSIFGAFTEKAEGVGMILDSAGVRRVSHTSSGKVTAIYVQSGEEVHKGDLLARLEQPSDTVDTRMAQQRMDLASSDREAARLASDYGAKKYQQHMDTYIYSPYDGIVDEIVVDEGTIVPSGTPICSVRITQKRNELSGKFYIPVDKGKRVKPGMTIQLAPNGVDVSESGSLIGMVRSVSQYPVTAQGVQQGIGNKDLAQWILAQKGGALMEVRFDLVEDKDSESGYLWTSVVGEQTPVTPGSFCRGSIVIDRRPPIEKVFYKISQWLRSR